jgi:hypothetical protein
MVGGPRPPEGSLRAVKTWEEMTEDEKLEHDEVRFYRENPDRWPY